MSVVDLSEFTINATYDKNVRPTGYEVVSCELGGIFDKNPAVADDGYALFGFLRDGVTGSAMTLKYTEAFDVKSGKNAAIVTQLKSKTATLKYGRDYGIKYKDNTDFSRAKKNKETDEGQLTREKRERL